MLTFNPRPYQEAGLDLMLREPGAGLFLEPGSGKTVTALTAADILMNERWTAQKTLVVAPKMVAQEVWSREVAKWHHTAHLKICYLDAPVFDYYRKVTTSAIWGEDEREIIENGMSADDAWFLFMAEVSVSRTEMLPRDWRKTKDAILKRPEQIHVVSRDHLYVLVKLLGKDWPYDLVLGDESTMFKNYESKRSNAIRYLRKAGLVKRITLMTGTPSPKNLENLFAQVRLLDNGRRLGDKIGAFRDRFMRPGFKDSHGRVFSYSNRPGATAEVTTLISDICLSVRADEWRETEAPRTMEHTVTLPPEARALYAEMDALFQIELTDATVTAAQAAVKANKLIQIASGAVFDNDKQYHVLHDAKLDALDELIEEMDGQPLLIVYWFKPTLARLRARYGKRLATTSTKGFIDQFAAGELPLLAIQPAGAGHGLDGLQNGGHHVAVVDLFYDWELHQQVVSRLDRSGQKHQVTVHQFIAADTRDEGVAKVLADRGADQGRVMDALRWS